MSCLVHFCFCSVLCNYCCFFFSPLFLLSCLQSSVQEVWIIVEQQFARLQTTVEEARKGVTDVLEGEKLQALRQAESIQAHLEQRRTELMKTLTQISKLSRSKSDVDFLQVQNKIRKNKKIAQKVWNHLSQTSHLIWD